MKKLLPGLLTVALIVVFLFAFRTTAKADAYNDFIYEISDGQVTITNYWGNEKDLVIPETIDGYPVTALGPDTFIPGYYPESLTLPPSITRIDCTFFDGDGLQRVYISDLAAWCNISFDYGTNPLTAGAELYLNSSLLTDLVIPDAVTAVKPYTFAGCQQLKSVMVHENVTDMGRSAFLSCEGLEAVYITDLAAWCNIAFDSSDSNPLCYAQTLYINGSAVTDQLTIPEGITALKDYVFWEFDGLRSIFIPQTVTQISPMAMTYCRNLKQIFVASANSVFASADGVLFSKDLTQLLHYPAGKPDPSYTIPATVTTIGPGAIRDSQHLKEVVMGDGLTTIEMVNFNECPLLESVSFGSGIQTIGQYSFDFCPNLKKVAIKDLSGWFSVFFDFQGSPFMSGSAQLYLNDQPVTKLIIPENITAIPGYAFWGCSSLSGVVLHKGITDIGILAFSNCANLTDVWYMGSEADKASIRGCETFKNATWHYHSCSDGPEHRLEWIVDQSGNCGDDGIKHEECTVCHHKQKENTPIPATGLHAYENDCDPECDVCHKPRAVQHSFEWVVDKKETCGNAGVKHEECTLCHQKQKENTPIPATGLHIFDWIIDRKETCGDDGIKHEECTVCHTRKSLNTKIAATGQHTYDSAEDGSCNICLQTREAGHHFQWVTDKEPACNVAGQKHEKCTICGEERSHGTEIPPLTHKFDPWKETKAPGCEEDGQQERSCALCHQTETEKIPAVGHDFMASADSKQPSCTENGADVQVCQRCGKETVSVLTATGHLYGDITVVKEATREEPGLKHQTCSVCGDTKKEVIPALGPAATPNAEPAPSPENNFPWIIIVIAAVFASGILVFIVAKKRAKEHAGKK